MIGAMQWRAVAAFAFLVACGAPAPAPPDGSLDGASRCGRDVDCSDAIYCNGLEVCAPSLPEADARGCVAGPPPCPTARFCVEAMRACTDDCVDADGDGHADVLCGGDDCDDGDAARFPGNAEICDGEDQDCDPSTLGDRDEDGDGAVDAACCNAGRCGLDCDDARAGVSPSVPEVCNGIDDDCDGSVDEGFECAASDVVTPRDCRTVCGSLGQQTCTASCVWSACRTDDEGPEVEGTCNRCDDDADGSFDEGFACVQRDFLPCDTQCGTRGIGFCTAGCELPAPSPAECVATTETCNYCDDDGDGTFEDDRGLVEPAPVVWLVDGCDDVTLGSGARCGATSFHPSGMFWAGPGVGLADGTTTGGRWQAWMDAPVAVGWGELSVDVTIVADATDAEALGGGWALVLATAPCGLGPTNDAGVPMDCVGIAVEWRFEDDDLVTVRRLTGAAPGETIAIPESVSGLAPGGIRVPLRVRFGYMPDLPSTPGNENAVRVEHLDLDGGGPTIISRDAGFGLGEIPRRELEVGDRVFVGVVSATGAAPVSVDWLLSATYTFASLTPMTVRAAGACAP